MQDKNRLRKEHGDTYATILPDGRVIPWRILTVKELNKYHLLSKSKAYSSAAIEDEVFSLVVQDEFLKENYSMLNAGVIPTVVSSVFAASSPADENELQHIFNLSRLLVNNIIYDIIEIICKAFPAYTPDVLMELTYEDLLIRLAQSERKLLKTGEITDIIKLNSKKEEKISESAEVTESTSLDKPPKEQVFTPPKSIVKEKETIITNKDRSSQMAAGGYSLQEKDENALRDAKDLKEMESIYSSHLSNSEEDGKIKILSYEERMEEAKKRMESNKELVKELRKKEAESLVKLEEKRIKKEQGIQVDGRYKGKSKRRR